jgi:hypothetical protein
MSAAWVLHPRMENGAMHTVSGKASNVEIYDFVVL